jgi:hypothetical protein
MRTKQLALAALLTVAGCADYPTASVPIRAYSGGSSLEDQIDDLQDKVDEVQHQQFMDELDADELKNQQWSDEQRHEQLNEIRESQ